MDAKTIGQEFFGSQARWEMPLISALWRLRQEASKGRASLGYILRPCLKNTKNKTSFLENTISKCHPMNYLLITKRKGHF
jgi:hypothetical protein